MASTARSRRALVALLTAAVLAALPMAARAAAPPEPNGSTLVEECRNAGLDPGNRECRTLAVVLGGMAQWCRVVVGAPSEVCGVHDGRDISEQQIAGYEASWTHRALTLQRALDADAPLVESLVPHTHNSFNSGAYFPWLSRMDHNQLYSMYDQLRMDMRGIEMDVHWAPSPDGDPAQGGMAPILCHGEPVNPLDEVKSFVPVPDLGPIDDAAPTVHVGCTGEPHLRTGLAEFRTWLDDHPDEFVMLYLENNLDGVPAAHDASAAAIQTELGDLVVRPAELGATVGDDQCAAMPYQASRTDLAAYGQVLIVGNCGPGAWSGWVHTRGPRWSESGSGPGDDYPGLDANSGCDAVREAQDYATRWIRHWEDETWVSTMAQDTPLGSGPGEVTPAETEAMVRCGVNMPGFDLLQPTDPQLPALVWSWAPDAPAAGGRNCAAQGPDGRFHDTSCNTKLAHACYTPPGEGAGEGDLGTWSVTSGTAKWKARGNCEEEFPGSHVAVPWNGWENERLRRAAAGATVWLDYAVVGGEWTPGASALHPGRGTPPSGKRPR